MWDEGDLGYGCAYGRFSYAAVLGITFLLNNEIVSATVSVMVDPLKIRVWDANGGILREAQVLKLIEISTEELWSDCEKKMKLIDQTAYFFLTVLLASSASAEVTYIEITNTSDVSPLVASGEGHEFLYSELISDGLEGILAESTNNGLAQYTTTGTGQVVVTMPSQSIFVDLTTGITTVTNIVDHAAAVAFFNEFPQSNFPIESGVANTTNPFPGVNAGQVDFDQVGWPEFSFGFEPGLDFRIVESAGISAFSLTHTGAAQ